MTTSSSSPAVAPTSFPFPTYSPCKSQHSSRSHAPHCTRCPRVQRPMSPTKPNLADLIHPALTFSHAHSTPHSNPEQTEQSQSFPKLPLCYPKHPRTFLSFADAFFSNSDEPLQCRLSTPTSHRGIIPLHLSCLRVRKASRTSSLSF